MSVHNFGMSSRTALGDGGVHNTQSGSRGEGKQYNPPAEIIRMPSGSLPVSQLEPLDFSQSRLNKPLLFALLLNFAIWGLFALVIRALLFHSH